MSPLRYRFAIDYFHEDGRRLGAVPVEPDWQPAHEWARFLGMRRGLLPPATAHSAGFIEPVWDAKLGEPVCSGVRVQVPDRDSDAAVTAEIPRSYFHALAKRNASTWIERGELQAGAAFRYHVCAYPACDEAPCQRDLEIEVIESPLPMSRRAIEPLLERAETQGDLDPEDAHVFLPDSVLGEVTELARQAGEMETGGVLVGRLHRAVSDSDIFLEVSAQIPAEHAIASELRFEFSPETWAAASAALELRGLGELICGWWHAHQNFCRGCPSERSRVCALSQPFFSPEDCHLHRTVFPQTFQVGLLISDLPESGYTPALFGWRHGIVVSRGYQLLR